MVPMERELLNGIYLVLMIVFFITKVAYGRSSIKKNLRRGPRKDSVFLFLVNISIVILPLLYATTSLFELYDYSLPDSLALIGISGLLLSTLISLKGHTDLGKNFTTAPGWKGDHTLITKGIYAHVRHPLYLSLLIWGLSTPLLLQNYIVGLFPLVCIIAFILVRVPMEERMLLEEFGDEYRSYQGRTGRLFPRLPRKAQ
jgi:protein-S-isoprenylcysteine O-methyltransferase Ste14